MTTLTKEAIQTDGTIKARRLLRTIIKVLAIGGALALTLLVAAHFTWKYSGSNQWELLIDANDVKIYTLKAPGHVVKRIKGVTHVKTTMNAAVESMMQTKSEDCAEWFPGCTSVQAVQPWNPQDLTYTHLYRLDPRPPFSAREVLIKARASQDTQTKAVLIEFMAMPDELPQDSCCFRLSHMHNTWRFTPLENGQVEVEVLMNVDLGVPYVMFNRFTPGALAQLLSNLQEYLNRDRWQHARYELIKEKS